jgi:hypothetical protein
MRLHERLGRAERAGTVPGRAAWAVRWQITPAGAAWLASQALAALRTAQNVQEAKTYARDLRVAVARMVDFHQGRAQPGPRDSSQADTPPHPLAGSPGVAARLARHQPGTRLTWPARPAASQVQEGPPGIAQRSPQLLEPE